MAKFNRSITEEQLKASLDQMIPKVLNQLPLLNPPMTKKARWGNGLALAMITTVLLMLSVKALNEPSSSSSVIIQSSSSTSIPTTITLSQQANDTLVNLAYVSAGLITLESQATALGSIASINRSSLRYAPKPSGQSVNPIIDARLPWLMGYFDRFRPYLDGGLIPFSSSMMLPSTRAGYSSMSQFSMDDVDYTLFMNQGATAEQITGILVIDDIEYTISGEIESEKGDELEMKLVAIYGDVEIIIEYSQEIEVDELEVKFVVETHRGKDSITRELQIEQEDDEVKVLIVVQEGTVEFRQEDGEDYDYWMSYDLIDVSGTASIHLGSSQYILLIIENSVEYTRTFNYLIP